MKTWSRVKWTEAAQIAERLEWKQDLGAAAAGSPENFFSGLRREGRLHEAAFFLGQALPRFETVAWAARAVRDLTGLAPPPGPDADALKAALLWVQDPSEGRRRAAWDAAGLAEDQAPERLAALAAFFSGGSIAPADCPPVPAPQEAAGRFAAGAVLVAAIRTPDFDAAINAALDAGDAIAAHGVAAGAA